ncbi:hypothetical protein NIES4103_62090 [Nostoc sp. NIES-4103]|nr:hypothetical protein NIES4103_62090 [Nostoc sp. NIES-4103]
MIDPVFSSGITDINRKNQELLSNNKKLYLAINNTI